MGEVVNFFPRQTLVYAAANDTYYSEIFDMTDWASMTLEARLYFDSGSATLTVTLEETWDPTLQNWELSDVDPAPLSSAAASIAKMSASNLLRFTRVTISSSAVTNATLSVQGIVSA